MTRKQIAIASCCFRGFPKTCMKSVHVAKCRSKNSVSQTETKKPPPALDKWQLTVSPMEPPTPNRARAAPKSLRDAVPGGFHLSNSFFLTAQKCQQLESLGLTILIHNILPRRFFPPRHSTPSQLNSAQAQLPACPRNHIKILDFLQMLPTM